MADSVKPQDKAGEQKDTGAANHESSQALLDNYLDLVKQIPGRLGKDTNASAAAMPVDTSTAEIYKGLFQADGTVNQDHATDLMANLKADQKGDIDAGGQPSELPSVCRLVLRCPGIPRDLDGRGDDYTNATADQKLMEAANKVLDPQSGIALTDEQRRAIEQNVSAINQDRINSLFDNPLESRYYQNDQRVIDDLIHKAWPFQIKHDMDKVLKDRESDKENEPAYVAADQAAVQSAKNVTRAFGTKAEQQR